MLAINLSEEVEADLARIARRTGVTRDELARRAILAYLEDQQDADVAAERLANPTRRWTQTALEQGLDLDD
jgi:RHH-type rel operon transcriptional repressor/antitoxin RelB